MEHIPGSSNVTMAHKDERSIFPTEVSECKFRIFLQRAHARMCLKQTTTTPRCNDSLLSIRVKAGKLIKSTGAASERNDDSDTHSDLSWDPDSGSSPGVAFLASKWCHWEGNV